MAKKSIHESSLHDQADDGDALADAALGDQFEEAGGVHVPTLEVGLWVYVWSAGHAFVGPIIAMDHEWIVLGQEVAPGQYRHAWVFDTGSIQQFSATGEGAVVGHYDGWQMIRRGGIITISQWSRKSLPPITL